MSYNAGASSGNLILLSKQSVSAVSAVEFTSVITTAYNDYVLEIDSLVGSAASEDLLIQFSTNNGTSYISTASYVRNVLILNSGGNSQTQATVQTSSMVLTQYENVAGSQSCGTVMFFNISSGTYYPIFVAENVCSGSLNTLAVMGGTYLSAIAVNAFQLFGASAGSITGVFRLYGVQK